MTKDEIIASLKVQHSTFQTTTDQFGATIVELEKYFEPGTTVNLVASPLTQPQGVPFTVAWSNFTGATAQAWVGLYRPGQADAPSIGYVYLNSLTLTPGSVPVPVVGSAVFPICTPPSRAGMPSNLPLGTYEFRLFKSNSSLSKVATSNQFVVKAAVVTPIITTDMVIAVPGDKFTVNWKDIANPTARDWMGFFKQGSAQRVWWSYSNGTTTPTIPVAAGAINFIVPTGTVAGMYEFRLYANDSTSNPLAVSQPVEIK